MVTGESFSILQFQPHVVNCILQCICQILPKCYKNAQMRAIGKSKQQV